MENVNLVCLLLLQCDEIKRLELSNFFVLKTGKKEVCIGQYVNVAEKLNARQSHIVV